MQNVLLGLIIAAFAGLLFLNIHFRVKVYKVYKRLSRGGGPDLKAVHIFNTALLEEEILKPHPKYRDDVLLFVTNIRRSVRMASVLIFLITLFTAILMFGGQ
ncbi:MAG: hypothetical protein AAF598_18945 [Bacteroidota bacterium]